MKSKLLNFHWRIFLIAFALRLIPVLLTRSLGIGLDDLFQYDMLARSLASGNGFRWYAYEDLQRLEPDVDFDLSSIDYDPVRGVPTSFRAPLYPAFLALIYRIVGAGAGRFFVVRFVQAGLSAALAPLTYLVSRRLFPGNKSASVISAWIVACYPLLVIYPIALATENLFFLFLLTAFYFLLRIPKAQFPFGKYAVLDFILADPERFMPLALDRLGFFIGLEKRALMYLYSNGHLGYFPMLLLLALAGILLLPFVIVAPSAALGLSLVRIRPGIILLYMLFVPYILVHVLILSEDRFHLALIPYLAILATQAWAGDWNAFSARWRESFAGKVVVSLAVLAVVLLFLNWSFELSRDADKIAALLSSDGNQTYFPY
jgi:hypothetical protein